MFCRIGIGADTHFPFPFQLAEYSFSNEIIWFSDADHAAAVNNIFGTMMGIKHGYPGLDGKDACTNLYTMPGKVKATCPLQKGQTYLYETVLAIKSSFPKVNKFLYHLAKQRDNEILELW